MNRFIIAALAVAATATPAFAANTTTSNGASVAFEATRVIKCQVANYENTINFGALGNLGGGGTANDPGGVDLFCNTPFDASVKSQNGFLRLSTLNVNAIPTSQSNLEASGYTGFAAAVDYSITTPIGSANSTAIGANSSVSLGTNLAPINQNNVPISYATIAGTLPLLAGTYQDTVTLTVTPIAL